MGGHLSINDKQIVTYDSRLLRAIDRNDNESAEYLVTNKKGIGDRVEFGHNALNLCIHRRNKKMFDTLIKAGCKLDLCDAHHMMPPLLQAVMLGKMEYVTSLVGSGCEVNIRSPENQSTALHIALIHGSNAGRSSRSEDIFTYLLSVGAEVNLQDSRGNTVLHLAAKLNQMSVLHQLMNGGRSLMDSQNALLQTPLHLATEGRHEDAAMLLMERGANVNAKDVAGCPVLLVAIEKWCEALVHHLVARDDINMNAANVDGWTSLHEACKLGDSSLVNLLLTHGSAMDQQDNNGNSPLHIAARQGNIEVVRLLLKKTANHYVTNKEGKSPLYLAVVTNQVPVVQLLLDSGADINQRDKVDKSALHAAVFQGNTSMVRMLVQQKADVNLADKHSRTPLLLASKHGRYEEAECLLRAGAHPDLYASDGKGALHMAVLFPKLDFPMIRLLLGAGCDPLNLSAFIDWMLQNGIVKESDFSQSEMNEWYVKLKRTPYSLKHQCRVAIQVALRRLYHDDGLFRSVIEQMPLPGLLQEYVFVKML